jgi:charged multivesicular body protein 4
LRQDAIQNELEELEQETLNERLAEADHVPVHMPPVADKPLTSEFSNECMWTFEMTLNAARQPVTVAEDDEEEQLRQLQASLAMG